MNDSLIAVIYLTIGLIGFIANLIVIYVKSTHKKTYSNITYTFMVQVSVADNFALSATSFCGSLFLTFPQFQCPILNRLFGFFALGAWYAASFFLCFVAFSRFVSITKPAKVDLYFAPKIKWAMIVGAWLFCGGYYSCLLWYPQLLFKWISEKVSWEFNVDQVSPFVTIVIWQNAVINTICMLTQIIFNAMTLRWLQKSRKTILTIDQKKNRRRETKLFVQCLVNSCLYSVTFLLFQSLNFLLEFGIENFALYFVMSLAWILHHSANPIIYFVINR
uniref:G-protein coupled receptors family 1 profile domain-containing protein n=1 Tax=Romanomermis culicivorax TaxID=13658 RepID=A0A915IQC0_ROMCU